MLLTLLDTPVDDADEVAAALRAGGEADLPAGGVLGLDEGHPVSTDGRDTGGFEPAGTGADDDDMFGPGGDVVGNLLRQIGLPSGGGIVDAGGRTGGVDRVEAHVGAHAGSDIVLASFGDLAREVRIGQLCAGHSDEVEASIGYREPGGRGIGDARGVEDGDVDGFADATAGLEPGRRGGAHAGDRLGELAVRVDHSDIEVEEIDAVVGVGPEDLGGPRFVHAVGAALVDGHADAEDEVFWN